MGFMTLRNVRTYRKNGEIEIRFELVRMYTAFFIILTVIEIVRSMKKG